VVDLAEVFLPEVMVVAFDCDFQIALAGFAEAFPIAVMVAAFDFDFQIAVVDFAEVFPLVVIENYYYPCSC
jgi:hypothetical protein